MRNSEFMVNSLRGTELERKIRGNNAEEEEEWKNGIRK